MQTRRSRIKAVAWALLLALVVPMGCRAPSDAPAARQVAVTPEPEPASTAATATPDASAVAAAAPAPDEPAEMGPVERMNEGCKYRKSTLIVSECTSLRGAKWPENLGAWRPTEAEVAVAFAATAPCYCADSLEPQARACMKKAGSTLFAMKVGKDDDPTDCTVHVASAESKGRRFIALIAPNRDLSTFYGTITIVELVNGRAKPYLRAFNATEVKQILAGADGVSKELHAEWSKLPLDLQRWIATD